MMAVGMFARSALLCLTLLFIASMAFARGEETLCGVANGYPPYQFLDVDGNPSGMDVSVIKRVFEKLERKVSLRVDNWDDVVAGLRLENLDCAVGMEITDRRKTLFDFTTPYYMRKVVVFIRADDTVIKSVYDLEWQVVAGDRDSSVEQHLRELGLRKHIRLFQPKSKDQSMQLLKQGEVVAVIAPKAVGLFLAHKHGVDVRILDVGDPGSPVGIAVKKGNHALLWQLDGALRELIREGALDAILDSWLGH